MISKKIVREAKTIDEAKEIACRDLCKIYNITKRDIHFTVIQAPAKKIFKTTPAIIEASLTKKAQKKILEAEKKLLDLLEQQEKEIQVEKERKERLLQEERERKERLLQEERERKEHLLQKEKERKERLLQEEREWKEQCLYRFKRLFLEFNKNISTAIYSIIYSLQECVEKINRVESNFIDSASINRDFQYIWKEFSFFESINDIDVSAFTQIYISVLNHYMITVSGEEKRSVISFNTEFWINTAYTNFQKRGLIYLQLSNAPSERLHLVWDYLGYRRAFEHTPIDEKIFIAFNEYFTYIYCIPAFILDNMSAKKLLVNQEMKTIVLNSAHNNAIAYPFSSLYDIYIQYYSCSKMDTLNKESFSNAISTSIAIELKKGNNLINYIDLLHSVGLDIDNITKTIISKKSKNESFFYYLLTKQIDRGEFDVIINNNDYDVLIMAFINALVCNILNYYQLPQYIREILQVVRLKDKIDLYHQKYSLLHMNSKKIDKTNEINNALKNVKSGIEFENVLRILYEYLGYKVYHTKATGDQGADLVIEKNDNKGIIQAKYYSQPVGNKAVQEVVAAMKFYDATKGIVITNSTFTKSAQELAKVNSIQMIDGNGLQSLINSLV